MYDFDSMAEEDVDPFGEGGDADEALEYLCVNLADLREFDQEAARQNPAVIFHVG